MVRGVVVAVEPTDVDEADELATDSIVTVTECLAGDCPETVRVRRRGGERDGRGLWVEGEAELAPGQEVVLFLRARAGPPRTASSAACRAPSALSATAAPSWPPATCAATASWTPAAWRSGAIELIDLDSLRASLARRAF